MPDLTSAKAGDVLVAASDERNVHEFRKVARVARRYLYLEAPWGEEAVDRATGRSHDAYPEFVAYTKPQWELHGEAREAHLVIGAAGVAHRHGGRLGWEDEDVVAFAAWLQERGLVPIPGQRGRPMLRDPDFFTEDAFVRFAARISGRPYLGDMTPQREHLYDEPEIGQVATFSVMELVEVKRR